MVTAMARQAQATMAVQVAVRAEIKTDQAADNLQVVILHLAPIRMAARAELRAAATHRRARGVARRLAAVRQAVLPLWVVLAATQMQRPDRHRYRSICRHNRTCRRTTIRRNQQQQQSSSSHSMAKSRGKNWAPPTSHTASVPVQRPIRVECYSDRLELIPDTKDQQVQVIPLGQRTEDSVEPLVAAVRTYTRSWGIAGRSMYWKPQLVLKVNPNADARAADLQTLLADSGWDVKRK